MYWTTLSIKRPATVLAALLTTVVLATLLVYWPGLSGPFVLDDIPNITLVHIENPDLDAVIYSIARNDSGMFGRSVSVLSFVLTGLMYGLDPWGYKFHNLLLHLCNGLLICRLAWLLIPPLSPGIESRRRLLISVSLAAFWLLHPLQVSTVLYVVQRMTELGAFFSLLSLLVYVEARRQLDSSRYFVLAWLAFPLCMVLALLSKETGALIPLYVLVIEVLVFRNGAGERRQPRLLCFLLAFAVLPVIVGGVYTLTHFDSLADYSIRNFTLYERLLTQLHVVAQYARVILLPRVRDMGLYHDDFPVTHELDLPTMGLLLLLLTTCAVIWLCRGRAPVLSFGLAWFLISHVLESTFIPLEMVFEHRNYLAAFGLLLPPLYYLFTVRRGQVLQLAAGFYIALMTFQTSSRVLEWSDEALIVNLAVVDHPRSARARTFLANHHYQRGRLEEALEHLRTAEEINPDDAGSSIHILGIQCREGVRDEAALERASQRLRQYPVSVYALNGMENILEWRGEEACRVLASGDIERLITDAMTQPDNTVNRRSRGYLLRLRGLVNLTQGQYAQGVIDFRTAYDLADMPEMIGELVNLQMRLRRFDDAEDTLDFLRELNDASHGILTYLVEKHSVALAQARKRADLNVESSSVVAGESEDASAGDANETQ